MGGMLKNGWHAQTLFGRGLAGMTFPDSSRRELVESLVRAWSCLFTAYLNIKVLDAPFQGLLMSGEKHVEPVSFDGAASVENLYRLAVAIAGDENFSAEGVSSVCRHKGIARLYFVSTGCYSI